jgi:mono/diheme cytochrome c family protein
MNQSGTKSFLLGVITTLLALAIGGFLYLRLGLAEVRGDVPASGFETYLMRAAVHASVRRNAPQLSNPIPPTDDNLIAGGKQYLGECAGCHGTPGKVPKFPSGLNPPVPQLPEIGTEYSEAQIFWVAKHGIRRTGMFSNGLWDSDKELWTLAAFIKRIKNLPPHVQEELQKKPAS